MAKRSRIIADPLDDLIPSRGPRTRSTAGKRASTADRIRSPSPKTSKRSAPAKAAPPSAKAAKRGKSPKAAPPPPPADTDANSTDWDDSHVRVTFYCPKALLGQVETEMARASRSKTRVIVDALQAHLATR